MTGKLVQFRCSSAAATIDADDEIGYIYLLHFSRPWRAVSGKGPMRHYIKFGIDMRKAIGNDLALLEAHAPEGVELEVTRVWKNSRRSELGAKRDALRLHAAQCKVCKRDRQQQRQDRNLERLLKRSVEQARQKRLPLRKSPKAVR